MEVDEKAKRKSESLRETETRGQISPSAHIMRGYCKDDGKVVAHRRLPR
jgi:hypothetical protein